MGGQELGTTFLALLRSDPSTRDLPVLVCSGDTPRLKELSGQLRAWGCDVLTKPFDIDVFVDAVRAGLGNGITTPGG